MTDIKWIGASSQNFTVGRPLNGQGSVQTVPVAIVCHIMSGGLAGTDGWFLNPNSKVTAHFGVGKQGQIHQYVKVADSAWANGIVESPDLSIKWLADAVNKNQWINAFTISIEFEGYYTDLLTDAQYQAGLWLIEKLCNDWHIPKDAQHIIGHFQITAYQRAHCPGPNFPWSQLMKDLNPVSQYDPSGGFSVGEGAVKILTQNGLTARTNENYYHDEAGQKVSLVYTNNDKLRVLTTFSPATGLWDTQLVQNVG